MNSTVFRQLLADELDSLYRMAFHLARRQDDAADIVQETCMRALRGEAGFQLTECGMKPWLFKILHNVFYTRLGKARRAPTLMEDIQYAPSPEDELNTPSPCWDLQTLDWEQVDDRLKHAIAQLPDHYREVLLLWSVEGLKYRQIAEILDVALGTVMSRLYRARNILSAQLASLAQEHGLILEPLATPESLDSS